MVLDGGAARLLGHLTGEDWRRRRWVRRRWLTVRYVVGEENRADAAEGDVPLRQNVVIGLAFLAGAAPGDLVPVDGWNGKVDNVL